MPPPPPPPPPPPGPSAFDTFDDGSSYVVREVQLDRLRTFTSEYQDKLSNIEEVLDASLCDVWDPERDPVRVSFEPSEAATIVDLAQTPHRVFNKLMLVFASLCQEAAALRDESERRFVPGFLCFGALQEEAHEGDAQVAVGRMFTFLVDFSRFVSRVQLVVSNIVCQLASLYSTSEKLYRQSFKAVHLSTVFDALGDLLVVLLSLDEVIAQNDTFRQAWQMFKRMTRSVRQEPHELGMQADEESGRLADVERLLVRLEHLLLGKSLYRACIAQDFYFPGDVKVRSNRALQAEFLLNLHSLLDRLDSFLAQPVDSKEYAYFMPLCALLGLYHALFPQATDAAFFTRLWTMASLFPIVHVAGSTGWVPHTFLVEYARPLLALLGKKAGNPDVQRGEYLRKHDALFEREVEHYSMLVSVWMVQIESNVSKVVVRQSSAAHSAAAAAKHKKDKKSGKHAAPPPPAETPADSARRALSDVLTYRVGLISKGLRLANRITTLFKTSVLLHSQLQVPLRSAHVDALCRCAELVKAIQATFHRRSAMLGESIDYMVQEISLNLQRGLLLPIKRRLEAQAKRDAGQSGAGKAASGGRVLSDARLDALAGVTMALDMLNGCATPTRRLLLRLALHVLVQVDFLEEREVEQIRRELRRLDRVCDLPTLIRSSCDTTFMFWSRELVPVFFSYVFKHPAAASRLSYMLSVLRDAVPLFRRAVHVADPHELERMFEREIEDELRVRLLDPVAKAIETDLRFHIHSHLSVSERNPLKTGLQDLVRFVKMRPLRLLSQRVVDFNAYVCHYLDTTFYNLTTVALSDGSSYAEMRSLAAEKYGLQLTEVHLPGQTLEQGIDVLEIMRNIHIFVARYNYNLNNQIFIEKQTMAMATTERSAGDAPGTEGRKNLNTINVQHIANSIRTHGMGIMNTTINFAYHFLRDHKFVIFSQFLFDEYIKGRLFKEHRFFKEHRAAHREAQKALQAQQRALLHQSQSASAAGGTDRQAEATRQLLAAASDVPTVPRYPFERAEELIRDIKKLGVSDGGLSYLDQFRILLTEIGNTMGYIRMVRSGGLLYTADAIAFVPDLADIPRFQELVDDAGLSQESAKASANLDASIDTLAQNFESGTEYFSMLVRVFAEQFRSADNAHFENFYLIVPALTVNWVEHMMQNKERLAKWGTRQAMRAASEHTTAVFTDDGFAIGIAYVLKLLDQFTRFDMLQWFDSVAAKLDAERKKIEVEAARRDKSEEVQSATLTVRKLDAWSREFELLRFSFTGSRIFFRDD